MPRPLLSIAPIAPIALAVASLALQALACDRMNQPMGHPRSTPRTSCFSDVECPSNGKCVKGPDDIQGTCTPRGGSGGAAEGAPAPGEPEGGEIRGDGGGPAPPPKFAPHPDDIQI
jgi:hypothetical protein